MVVVVDTTIHNTARWLKNEERFFAKAKPKIPLLVVPRSFFAPKPHGNACNAGYTARTV